MVSPTRGWLRGLRATALGVVGFALALLAHVTAAGAPPGSVVLSLLAGLTALAAVLLTAVRLSPLRIGMSLAAMQVLLHEAFTWLAAPAECAMAGVSVSGAMQVGQVGHPALSCAAVMAHPGMVQGSAFGATAMLGAHVAATALMAALLAYGEKALWFLARWVRPAPWLRVRLPQLPAPQALSSASPPIAVRVRLAAGGVGRRGPPPRALSAIV
jgi:hypothetical protein